MPDEVQTTTLTVTEPLKAHLKRIKEVNEQPNLDQAIQYVMEYPLEKGKFHVRESNTEDEPATIKIKVETLSKLQTAKEQSEHHTYEDLIRQYSGATPREPKGEEPIEWEPL